jgi:hypothetical protein
MLLAWDFFSLERRGKGNGEKGGKQKNTSNIHLPTLFVEAETRTNQNSLCTRSAHTQSLGPKSYKLVAQNTVLTVKI